MTESDILCRYIDSIQKEEEMNGIAAGQKELLSLFRTSRLLKHVLGEQVEAPIRLRRSLRANLQIMATKREIALGEAVEEERQKRGIRKERLAQILGIAPEILANIEHGFRLPKSIDVNAIASAVGISREELEVSTRNKLRSKKRERA